MKTCEYCGSRVENSTIFCPHCGASKFKTDPKPVPQYYNPYTNQSAQGQRGQYRKYEEKPKKETKLWSILALIFAFLAPPLGFIFSIASLAICKYRPNRKLATASLIISIIMIIIMLS